MQCACLSGWVNWGLVQVWQQSDDRWLSGWRRDDGRTGRPSISPGRPGALQELAEHSSPEMPEAFVLITCDDFKFKCSCLLCSYTPWHILDLISLNSSAYPWFDLLTRLICILDSGYIAINGKPGDNIRWLKPKLCDTSIFPGMWKKCFWTSSWQLRTAQ